MSSALRSGLPASAPVATDVPISGAAGIGRLEDAAGRVLDRGAIALRCRDARSGAFAVELVRHDHGDADGRRVLGRAVLSGERDPGRLARRLAAVGAVLAARANTSTGAVLADPLPPPVRSAPGGPGRIGTGWARLRRAAFVERRAVGIADRPLADAIGRGLGPVRWLRNEGGIAAPAPWADDRLVFEQREARSGRARLLAASADADGRLSRGRVLLEGAHDVAHPSVAAFEGRFYVLPSTPDAGATTLWRLSPGGGLAAVATVAPGRRLHDPTLFRADGLWWIAAADDEWGADDNLCLWHALRPHGPWRPHALNPVKLDCRSSRPAGSPFRAEGRLWRPAQDCARGPGSAVMLNLVETLTPSAYREHPIRRLGPDRAMPHGIATVATWHDRTLVDGTRLVFSPRRLARVLLDLSCPGRRR